MTAEEIEATVNEGVQLFGEMRGMVAEYLAGGVTIDGMPEKLEYKTEDIQALITQWAAHWVALKALYNSITPIPGYP